MMRTRAAQWSAVLVLAAALAGCAGKGPKPAVLPDFKAAAKVRVAWNADIGDSGRYIFSPAHVDGAVYAAAYGGEFMRLDGERGRRIWRVKTEAPLSGGVGVGENMILLGTVKGAVLAYGSNGKLLWRSQVSSEVLSAPAGSPSMVIVRSGDSKVFGLDPKDGARKWEYQGPTPSLTLRSNPGLVIVQDTAVVGGFPGGRLIVLNLKDGGVLWDTTVATPRGDNELERIADIAGTPLVEPARVCAVTFQGRVGCYETQKGAQIWGRAASSAGSLSADASSVYYTEGTGQVVALDKASGASVWRQEALLNRRVSAPLGFRDWVVVGDYQGYVHFLSREDGSFVARIATDGSGIVAQPLSLGDRVLVQTQDGGLYAIEIKGS